MIHWFIQAFRRNPMRRWHFKMQGLDTGRVDIITSVANHYQCVESAEDAFRRQYGEEPLLLEYWTTDLTD